MADLGSGSGGMIERVMQEGWVSEGGNETKLNLAECKLKEEGPNEPPKMKSSKWMRMARNPDKSPKSCSCIKTTSSPTQTFLVRERGICRMTVRTELELAKKEVIG